MDTGGNEKLAWLGSIPVISTAAYYYLPSAVQANLSAQFAPQATAYLCLAIWMRVNGRFLSPLGLQISLIPDGFRWGMPTGVLLGMLNTTVILWVVPSLGLDIAFLTQTPHARVPTLLMVPWLIVVIAIGVEINFRGFLLGRLLAGFHTVAAGRFSALAKAAAVCLSALTFAFDPFMVMTFRQLHWIAVWDGVIWGIVWLQTRNLYATIIAHAVEVIVTYSAVKYVLS